MYVITVAVSMVLRGETELSVLRSKGRPLHLVWLHVRSRPTLGNKPVVPPSSCDFKTRRQGLKSREEGQYFGRRLGCLRLLFPTKRINLPEKLEERHSQSGQHVSEAFSRCSTILNRPHQSCTGHYSSAPLCQCPIAASSSLERISSLDLDISKVKRKRASPPPVAPVLEDF